MVIAGMGLPSERGPPAATIVRGPRDRTRRNTRPRLPDNRSPPHRRRQPARKSPRQHRSHPHAETDRSRKPRRDRRGKIRARPLHGMGRDAECLPSLSAAGMAAGREPAPRTSDRRRIRVRARLDPERSLHLARWSSRRCGRPCSASVSTDGAQILEPSMGVGHFLGLMPDELAARTPQNRRRTRQHHRPDRAAASIRTRRSSPKASRRRRCPTISSTPSIGNIPFGNYPVYDPAYRRQPALTRTIHDYFLAKSLDKLRAGGVMALITSRYTMDKQDSTIRRYLADRADLVGAIRLPNTAFKANAGTEVTTDILFLQKRAPGTPARAKRMARPGAHRNSGRADPHQRIFRAASRDDAGRDAARGHDVQERRADARGRADPGASG